MAKILLINTKRDKPSFCLFGNRISKESILFFLIEVQVKCLNSLDTVSTSPYPMDIYPIDTKTYFLEKNILKTFSPCSAVVALMDFQSTHQKLCKESSYNYQ
jgi:hypothetical protein